MKHTLAADGIQLSFNQRRILSDVYIQCETGKITGLLGRNGQGKSCLLNIIYGSMSCDDKSVRINNISSPQAFTRSDLLQYIPQSHFIPKQLTLKRIFADFDLSYSLLEQQFAEYKNLYKYPIGSLSGGQQRFIEVYCIIRSRAQFALLDKPFSFLSPILVEKLKEVLRAEQPRKGFLITDHMYPHILEVSDTLYVLQNGKTHFIRQQSELEKLGYLRASHLE